MSPLILHHLRTYIQHPATGIFLAFGWVLVTLLTLAYGEFIAANHAGLELMYGYVPWVLCLLIPALTMYVAEERARGVHERLHTLPFTPAQHVMARFFVCAGLLGLWLLGLWPMAATVFYLGSPDVGPLLSGLLGCWLFALVLLAASLWVVGFARNAVAGFLMGLGICLLLTMLGAPQTIGWFKQTIPGLFVTPTVILLQTVTPFAALADFISGSISLGALSQMLGLIAVFLVLSLPASVMTANLRTTSQRVAVGVVALALLAPALVPPLSRLGVDVTADRLHSLSPATVKYLKSLHQPVTFTLVQSMANRDIPSSVLQNAQALRALLLNMQAENPQQITVKQLNPDASPAASLQALQLGVEEQVLPSGTGFFSGLVAQGNGPRSLIRALDPSRRPFLEFDVMALLSETLRTHKPNLAMLTDMDFDNPVGVPRWPGDIAVAYGIEPMALDAAEVPAHTDLLLVVGNLTLPEQTMQAIKSYLSSGGKVVWLTDPLWRTLPRNQLPTGGSQTLAEMFSKSYGLDTHPDEVVADTSQATPVAQEKIGYTAYPFWLSLGRHNLAPNQPFASFVESLLMAEAGPITVGELATGLTYTPIITTSDKAQLMPREEFNATPAELLAGKLKGTHASYTLAALITGKFGADAAKPATLLVVNDIDWLANEFALRMVGGMGAGEEAEYVPLNSNQILFFNMLQYALGETALVELRGKATGKRSLTRVEELLNRLAQRTTLLEQNLAAQLYQVNQHLEQLEKAGDQPTQDQAQKDEISNYQWQQFVLRQQVRVLRNQAREQIQDLGTAILLLNLFTMPVLLTLGLTLARRRPR